MDLSPVTTTITPVDEKLWLASKHGTDCPDTITLNIGGGSFAGVIVASGRGDGYGVVPSGTPVKKSGALYVLNTTTAACDGHVLEDVRVHIGSTVNAGGSLLWHGEVVSQKVDDLTGVTFAVATDAAKFIRYV